jgi:hypothetical protein
VCGLHLNCSSSCLGTNDSAVYLVFVTALLGKRCRELASGSLAYTSRSCLRDCGGHVHGAAPPPTARPPTRKKQHMVKKHLCGGGRGEGGRTEGCAGVAAGTGVVHCAGWETAPTSHSRTHSPPPIHTCILHLRQSKTARGGPPGMPRAGGGDGNDGRCVVGSADSGREFARPAGLCCISTPSITGSASSGTRSSCTRAQTQQPTQRIRRWAMGDGAKPARPHTHTSVVAASWAN